MDYERGESDGLDAQTNDSPPASGSSDSEESQAGNSEIEIPDPLSDGDPEHFQAVQGVGLSVSDSLRQGLFLFRVFLDEGRRPWSLTGSNDFSAGACFTRAYRAIRASTLLAVFGYYDEVPTVLREAYECAAMGRYLARQPEIADKWLERAEWIPDRKVRAWFGDDEGLYAERYGGLSKRSHPTAAACLRLIDPKERDYRLRFASELDRGVFEDSLHEILATVLWMIFALKNAAADEAMLPPEWREQSVVWVKEAGHLLESHSGVEIDFDHLDHDWDKVRSEYERLVSRVLKAEDLDKVLAEDPRSWQNLKESTERDS